MKIYEITEQQIIAVWNQIKKFPGEDVVPVHTLLINLKPINIDIKQKDQV